MLQDIERKVLRIIYNYSTIRRRPPTIDVISVKTGRDRGGVMTVLEVLAREKYIEWNRSNPDHMVVIEGWERKDEVRWRGR
ncbi:hypothetical protein NSQ24_01570 [Brevibacillus sp. FSL L8-0520]|uniref:hypothetical protein n=1 Tax=Brevibacillus sp. FSL L8-0520 TaxID=2954689 RepID=UPI0030CD3B2F